MTLPKRPELSVPIPNSNFESPEIYQIRGPYWDYTVGEGLSVDSEGSVQIEGLPSQPPQEYLYSPNGLTGVGAGLVINSDGVLVVD